MTNSISNVFVKTFERNVRFLAQQKGSKLRSFCQLRGENSETHAWERVGKLTASTKSTRATASPVNDTPFTRRVDSLVTKAAGDLVEHADIAKLIIDPTSAITQAIGFALGRAIDDIIIAAATGDAVDGAGETHALPAGQVVGDGTEAITLDLVAACTQAFMTNDIDAEQPKVMVVGPVQVRQLASIRQATDIHYVNAKALAMSGMVKDWMGYTWIYSNRLTAPAEGQLACLAFSEMAMGLRTPQDIWTRVAEDPSRSFAWQVYGEFTAGAVRVEDEHMVEFDLKNT